MWTPSAVSGTSTSWPSPAAATLRRRRKADSLGIARSYGSYEALLDNPGVQVVHNATPNYLHYPVNAAALARGKHVVSDKPLAMTAAESRKLLDQATKAGVVHAVTFNYRGNPLVQQARLAIARGDIGRPQFLVGQYLQDWLLKDTDYSWRLEPDKGGASSALGDIGSHWCDLAQHVSGLRIAHVLGDITTVIPKRKSPTGAREAFQAAGATRCSTWSTSRSRIWRRVIAAVRQRREGGVLGRPGLRGPQERSRTRNLRLEDVAALEAGAAERALDRPPRQGQRDPAEGSVAARRRGARLRAPLPGGHQEAWADAFCNLMRDIYGFIAAGHKPSDAHPPAFATFEDGYRANCIVEAILESAKQGSAWTEVKDQGVRSQKSEVRSGDLGAREPGARWFGTGSRSLIADPVPRLVRSC